MECQSGFDLNILEYLFAIFEPMESLKTFENHDRTCSGCPDNSHGHSDDLCASLTVYLHEAHGNQVCNLLLLFQQTYL